MLEKAKEYDPELQLILPDKDHPAVDCNFYGPGCINGTYVRIRGIEIHVIQYTDEDSARRAATRFNAFYRYNWLFEEIQNEPILQDFVKTQYKAKRPPPPIKDSRPPEKKIQIIDDSILESDD